MDYECVKSERDFGWAVEAIDYENDGVVYRALFTGPKAEERAKEYAAWKRESARAQPQGQYQQRRSAA